MKVATVFAATIIVAALAVFAILVVASIGQDAIDHRVE